MIDSIIKYLLIFFVVILTVQARAQSSNSIMISAGADIIKTDIDEVFQKAQLGFEAHYFVVRHFAVGAGAEIWTEKPHSFVMSMRWYTNDKIFVRLRGLTGANDAALGIGYAFPLSERFKIEGIGDFYFRASDFALRGGISYIIN
jgi:hypothetical protein